MIILIWHGSYGSAGEIFVRLRDLVTSAMGWEGVLYLLEGSAILS